ncbi:hypothetical protein, partial [Streptomyces chilikensis]|uniref:hypothetical protein n=1 Tax=Streptomyces chilikensis TaxID=1194079 RepID=UPI0019D03362
EGAPGFPVEAHVHAGGGLRGQAQGAIVEEGVTEADALALIGRTVLAGLGWRSRTKFCPADHVTF